MEPTLITSNNLILRLTRVFDFLSTEELNIFSKSKNTATKLAFLHSSAKREDDNNSEYINFFTKSHLQVKCPPKALFYFPTDLERIVHHKSKKEKNLRRIFQGDPDFIPFEREKIDEMNKMMEEHNKEHKTAYNIIDPLQWLEADTLRLLQATSFNMEKSLTYIIDNIEWRKANEEVKLSANAKKIVQMGFMYAHGRDNRYRPIIILDAAVYLNNKDLYPYEDWLNSIIFMMNYFVNSHNVLVPGQIENWNMIIDMQNVSVMGIPAEFKDILKVMSSNFRCRLYVNFLLNMSFFVRGLWKVIKSFLDPVTQNKVRILGKSDMKSIFEFIHPSQVEKKLGGLAPNLTGGYFPPPVIEGPIKVCPEDELIYLSRAEYAAKISSGNYRRHPDFSKWGRFFSLERERLQLLTIKREILRISNEDRLSSLSSKLTLGEKLDEEELFSKAKTTTNKLKKMLRGSPSPNISRELPTLNMNLGLD